MIMPTTSLAGVAPLILLCSVWIGQASGQPGLVTAWGWNEDGQCDVPEPNAGFTAADGGHNHSLGLKADGSILAWGNNEYGQCNVPTPNVSFAAVAAGSYHSLGLKQDGSIVTWGRNSHGQLDIPEPNESFVAVAAGLWSSLALKSDGSIVAWGGLAALPAPNAGFIKIAAGSYHGLGLRTDGSIVAWGENDHGQCDVPSPNSSFVSIAGGWGHSLGLKSDGTIVAWGNNGYGECEVPEPNSEFVAITGSYLHSLGLKAGGQVFAWGFGQHGQTETPEPNCLFHSIAVGSYHSFALRDGGGACCFNNGSCQLLEENECWTQGGDWHGPCVLCDPSPCPQPTFYSMAGTVSGYPGETVTVALVGELGEEIKGYSANVVFDSNVFEFVSSTVIGTIAEGAAIFNPNFTDHSFKAGVVYDFNCPGIGPGIGDLLFVDLRIRDSAPLGTTLFSIEDEAPTLNRVTNCLGHSVIVEVGSFDFEVLDAAAGACCLEDAICMITLEQNCIDASGGWQGATTICEPNPCIPDRFYFHTDQVVWDGQDGEITVGMINGSPLLGYSIHLDYVPGAFEVIGLSLEGTVAEGAEYFAASFTDTTVTAGVVYSYACPPSIEPGEWIALRIVVQAPDQAPEGMYGLSFLDAPPALNRMAACDGSTITPLLFDGGVELRWRRFVRGDITADGSVDISDPIFSLSHQFVAGPAPECSESEDIDDSGEVNISDPIHLLAYMFAGGEPPALPFPDCGVDPTGFDLGCDCFPPCEYPCGSDSKSMDSEAVRMELVEGGTLHLEVLETAGSDTLWAFLEGDLLGELSALETALWISGEELEFAGFQPSPALSACDFVESAEWAGEGPIGLPWASLPAAGSGDSKAAEMTTRSWQPDGAGDAAPSSDYEQTALVRLGIIPDLTMTEVIGPGPLRIGRFGFVRKNPIGAGEGIRLLDGLGVTPGLEERLLVAETTQPSGVPEGGRSTEALDSAPSFRLPNPYRPGSPIQLRLGVPDGLIKVDLYDVQGRRVARLFEGPVTGSTLDLVWDGTAAEGTSVSSGLYLLKATGSGLSLTRRLVVVR